MCFSKSPSHLAHSSTRFKTCLRAAPNAISPEFTREQKSRFSRTTGGIMSQSSATHSANEHVTDKNLIRAFQVNVPEADLADLRRRISATRWPERETVTDATQGVQLATMQALAKYWETEYDWRKCEARLN